MENRERGFTLLEILITLGIIALLAATGIGLTLSSRPFELTAATQQFDALVDASRTMALAYGDGATIAVSPANNGAGFRATVYAHLPSDPEFTPTTAIDGILASTTGVAVSERTTLQAPAFAIIIHGNGAIGGRPNYRPGDPLGSPETACPAGGAYVFVFNVGGQTATRSLPCHIDLALTGPVLVTPTPPPGAGPSAVPVPCSAPGDCTAPTPAPETVPTCPPSGASVIGGVACRYPLLASPAELRFANPGDTAPEIFDGSGIDRGVSDPDGSVHLGEQYYNATYTVGSGNCAPIIAPITSPLGPDTGSGVDFSVNALGTAGAFGQCALAITDANGQTRTLPIRVAQALTVTPTSVSFPDHTKSACLFSDNTVHDPCAISVAKWGYDPPHLFLIDDANCRAQTQATASVSNLTALGETTSAVNFLIAPLNVSSTPCTITVADQLGESTSVKVQVPTCLPGSTGTPPNCTLHNNPTAYFYYLGELPGSTNICAKGAGTAAFGDAERVLLSEVPVPSGMDVTALALETFIASEKTSDGSGGCTGGITSVTNVGGFSATVAQDVNAWCSSGNPACTVQITDSNSSESGQNEYALFGSFRSMVNAIQNGQFKPPSGNTYTSAGSLVPHLVGNVLQSWTVQ